MAKRIVMALILGSIIIVALSQVRKPGLAGFLQFEDSREYVMNMESRKVGKHEIFYEDRL